MVPAGLKFHLDAAVLELSQSCVLLQCGVWLGSVAVRSDDVMSGLCCRQWFFLCSKANKLRYFIPSVCFNKCYNTGEQYSSFLGYEGGMVFVLFSEWECQLIAPPIFSSFKSFLDLWRNLTVKILCITCFVFLKITSQIMVNGFALCALL